MILSAVINGNEVHLPRRGGHLSLKGDENQDLHFASFKQYGVTTFGVTNSGGAGIHGMPHEHGCYIHKLYINVEPSEIAEEWESDFSIGWRMKNGDIIAVRDGRIFKAKRTRIGELTLIGDHTKREPWRDNPWQGDEYRYKSLQWPILPGGRGVSFQVVQTSDPVMVEVDDWTKVDTTAWAKHLRLHEGGHHPSRLREWIDSFSNVGVRRGENGELIFSDMEKTASFVTNFVQGPARWDWDLEVDPELDIRDIPDGYHRDPFFWGDLPWADGHTNLHYETCASALREFVRFHRAGDGPRAFWAWWLYCRFSKWSLTGGLCFSEGKHYAWQWGEKSVRSNDGVRIVGGQPGSFALTPQKLFTENIIAATANPSTGGYARSILDSHVDAVLGMGEGDRRFGARDMQWIAKAKAAIRRFDPELMPFDEIQQSADKIMSERDEVGLWLNEQYPGTASNVFEQAQSVLGIAWMMDLGATVDQTALNSSCIALRERCVREYGRWALNTYMMTHDNIPGKVNGSSYTVNSVDLTEFSRPFVAAALGWHALVFNDAESRRIFLKMCETLGELMDWRPPLTRVEDSILHPEGRDQRDVRFKSEHVADSTHPGFDPDWHGGRHFNSWWKICAPSFMLGDIIAHLRGALK